MSDEHTSGCCARYRKRDVVPAFDTPAMSRFGNCGVDPGRVTIYPHVLVPIRPRAAAAEGDEPPMVASPAASGSRSVNEDIAGPIRGSVSSGRVAPDLWGACACSVQCAASLQTDRFPG